MVWNIVWCVSVCVCSGIWPVCCCWALFLSNHKCLVLSPVNYEWGICCWHFHLLSEIRRGNTRVVQPSCQSDHAPPSHLQLNRTVAVPRSLPQHNWEMYFKNKKEVEAVVVCGPCINLCHRFPHRHTDTAPHINGGGGSGTDWTNWPSRLICQHANEVEINTSNFPVISPSPVWCEKINPWLKSFPTRGRQTQTSDDSWSSSANFNIRLLPQNQASSVGNLFSFLGCQNTLCSVISLRLGLIKRPWLVLDCTWIIIE